MPDFEPIQNARLFNRNTLYAEMDWTDLRAIIKGFRARIENWYLRPIQKLRSSSGHYSFCVTALTCTVVDTISQYEHGLTSSKGARFKQALRRHDLIYSTEIDPVIEYRHEGEIFRLTDYADAIWSCYRCGILHESHVMLCGVISGIKHSAIIEQVPGLTRYSDGRPCPTLVLDPNKFFNSVEDMFDSYIRRLRDPQKKNNQLRINFAKKFLQSFGVPIPVSF